MTGPGVPLGVALNMLGALGLDASKAIVMCSGCWDGNHGLCEQPCQCTHRGTGVPGHEHRPAVQLVTPAQTIPAGLRRPA